VMLQRPAPHLARARPAGVARHPRLPLIGPDPDARCSAPARPELRLPRPRAPAVPPPCGRRALPYRRRRWFKARRASRRGSYRPSSGTLSAALPAAPRS
jgi:hypothetical protein